MEGRKGQAPVPGALDPGSGPDRHPRHRDRKRRGCFRSSQQFPALPAPASRSLRPYPALLLLLLLPSVCVAAGIYKWRDADGNIHYGDRPPPESAAQSLDIDSAPSQPAPDASRRREKQRRLLDIYREDRRRREDQRTAAEQEKQERERNCKLARRRLEATRNASFLYEKTGDPMNPKVLTRDERQAQTQRLEEQVKKWCR